jgi:hypothetical protein
MAVEGIIPAASIYRHANPVQLDDNSVVYRLPERMPFVDDEDVILHIATGNDYLWDISQAHWGSIRPDAFDLWEVIADYQPDPIQDRSVRIPRGKEIFLPSVDYLDEVYEGDPLTDVPEM